MTTYTNRNFKSKKALKEAVAAGQDIYCHQAGMGPDVSTFTGNVCLCGPHYPEAHKWYAEAQLVGGRVVKVK